MKPFYVDVVQVQNSEKPGVDGTFIVLNCKQINFPLFVGDCIKISKNSHELALTKIEKVEPDGLFSHWKLETKIITISPKTTYFEYAELKSGQYFYIKEYGTE
jgi:hypothetical protein